MEAAGAAGTAYFGMVFEPMQQDVPLSAAREDSDAVDYVNQAGRDVPLIGDCKTIY